MGAVDREAVDADPDTLRVRRGIEVSQGLIIAWCLWLLSSWWITLGVSSPAPAARWMVFASLIGLMLLWPAWRLSQAARVGPDGHLLAIGAGQVLVDWATLNLVFQTIILPLRLTAGWTMPQTLWLDAAVMSWSLVSALFVGWGCRSWIGGHRAAAMGLCLLLVLGEPALMGTVNLTAAPGHGLTWAMMVSPIQAVWALTSPAHAWSPQPWATQIVCVAIAAVLGWVVLALLPRDKQRELVLPVGPTDQMPDPPPDGGDAVNSSG